MYYNNSNLQNLGIPNNVFSKYQNTRLNIMPPIFENQFTEYNPSENSVNENKIDFTDSLTDFYKKKRFGTDYSIECLSFGINCPDSFLGSTISNVTDIVKKISIVMLALILLGFGLYSLVTSTKTGQAALNLASKV